MFLYHRRILSLPVPSGSLSFQSSRKGTPTYFLFPHLWSIAHDEIQRRLQERQKELEAQPKPYYASVINYRLLEQAEAREVLMGYESYMEKCNDYATHMAKVIDLQFVLTNEGNASADDTDVYIYIDGKFLVVDEDRLAGRPKTAEQRKRDAILQGMARTPLLVEKPNVTGPMIRRTPREQIVQFHIERLKQGNHVVLGTVYADFSAASEIRSFGLRYSLNSHSLRKDTEDDLHVVIETA